MIEKQSLNYRFGSGKTIRRTNCFLMIISLIIASSSGSLLDVQDLKARIVEASGTLFGTSATKETLVDSLAQLLDVVVELTSESQYEDEIRQRIDIAKDLLQNQSLFNDKARQYLSFAYRMITNGQKYQKPKELDEFVTPSEAQQKALEYAKKLIAESLSELESGHKQKAAKPLLELVLMVITPISG